MVFECSDCLDDRRGPGIANPMQDIVNFLDSYNFNTYRIGMRKLLQVNGEFWDDIYERRKFWSNCFSCKKDDPIINQLIDSEFEYRG